METLSGTPIICPVLIGRATDLATLHLLVIEDMHWSDETSLDFLHYLARRSMTQPLLLLLTYRSDEVRPRLRTMPHPAKRVSLELDAREREHQVETIMSDSVQQLQVLLGKSGKEGRGSAPGTVGKIPVSARASLPQVAHKPTKARVGERRNVRDSIGETGVPAGRAALGCAFTNRHCSDASSDGGSRMLTR
jgi:hypothetical protein